MDDKIYFYDMLKASKKILEFTGGMNEDDFKASELHQNAVIRLIQVIGEAARLVSDSSKTQYPSIPWRSISGMRNHVVHRYFDVDLHLVWGVIQTDLAVLIQSLEALLGPDEGKESEAT
jgi:uncharacterized protein with HEPN domain